MTIPYEMVDDMHLELRELRRESRRLAARLAEAERLLRVAYSLHGAIEAAAVSHDFQMQYVRFLNRGVTADSAEPQESAV